MNTYHMNDVCWTQGDIRGGGGGGACPTTNSCVINQRASFLLVKSSTVNLMNNLGPGYHWSA